MFFRSFVLPRPFVCIVLENVKIDVQTDDDGDGFTMHPSLRIMILLEFQHLRRPLA